MNIIKQDAYTIREKNRISMCEMAKPKIQEKEYEILYEYEIFYYKYLEYLISISLQNASLVINQTKLMQCLCFVCLQIGQVWGALMPIYLSGV